MNGDDIGDYRKELDKIRQEAEEKLNRLATIEKQMEETEQRLQSVAHIAGQKLKGHIVEDEFVKFFRKPYAVIPQKRNQVLVIVPKFIKNFQAGWLWKEIENFYIYQLDQYAAWLGDVPQDLLDEIEFTKELSADVEGDSLVFDSSQIEAVKKRLKPHLKDITDTSARIIKGHEFDLIADMIDSGCLPFKPQPVAKQDTREGKSKIKLRSYQQPAFEKFMQTGAVGLFHPTGAGKSMVALMCMDVVKGQKLVLVPTRSLLEQWEYYVEKYLPHAKNEVRIATYQGYRIRDDEYALVVFDEAHKLPANTFSRLSLIPTKYRLGLSASPHREDAREKYIFALTGFPVGLNWKQYMETVGRTYHPIFVHRVRGEAGKIRKMWQLVDMRRKTLVFCDSIELGKKASKELGVPFIYGETENRLETIAKSRVVVASRVLDLGVSIKDLEHIIEIDFLFGSRQQELQRTGRLMHSEAKNARHDIVMTDVEFKQYGKRLWALQEKGFTVKLMEAA